MVIRYGNSQEIPKKIMFPALRILNTVNGKTCVMIRREASKIFRTIMFHIEIHLICH